MKTEKEILIWAKTLFLVLEGKTKNEKEAIARKMAEILKRRKKEYFLPGVVRALERLYQKKKRVELSFAREQKGIILDKVKDELLELFGKDKSIDVKVEEGLIGGFRAKTENLLIKASIKDFLNELKNIYYR